MTSRAKTVEKWTMMDRHQGNLTKWTVAIIKVGDIKVQDTVLKTALASAKAVTGSLPKILETMPIGCSISWEMKKLNHSESSTTPSAKGQKRKKKKSTNTT